MKKAFLNDVGIAYKLILLNVLLIMIAIGVSSQLAYRISRYELGKKVDQVHAGTLIQTKYTLSSRLRMMERAGNIILFDPEVRGFLTSNVSSETSLAQLQYQRSLAAKLGNFETVYGFLRVRLYIDNEAFFANERVNFFPLADLDEKVRSTSINTNDVWLLDGNPGFLQMDPLKEDATISHVKVIRDTKDIRSIIGAVRVDIAMKEVVDTLGSLQLIETAQVILADPASGDFITLADSPELMQAYADNPEQFTSDVPHNSAMNGYSVFTCNLDGPRWRIIMAVNEQQLDVSLSAIRKKITYVMIAVGCVTILLSFIVGNSIVTRINTIAAAMNRIHKGDMGQGLVRDGNDEIGKLQDDFNFMKETIDRLLVEQYKLGRDLKGAELMALQSQINPHFLYNTLDLINWISLRDNAEEISDIVDELSRFYRISLSRGEDVITIETELEHVELYLNIQNRRFDNKIAVSFEVDEEVLLFQIPKLTLQPLIENAITHGIMEKAGKAGRITIRGKRTGCMMRLTIEDDGVGVSEEYMHYILNGADFSEQKSYGVFNIDQRLKTRYGEESGLRYAERRGGGTIVEVILPAIICSP